MSVLMSESFINSFKRLIHSETSQLAVLMNRPLNHWLTRFIQKRVSWLSLWIGHWIIDSLDSFKNVDSFSKETPLCVAQRHNSSAVALIVTIFGGEIEQKQSVFCLKSKSLNFNLLFIEILLYKISCHIDDLKTHQCIVLSPDAHL